MVVGGVVVGGVATVVGVAVVVVVLGLSVVVGMTVVVGVSVADRDVDDPRARTSRTLARGTSVLPMRRTGLPAFINAEVIVPSTTPEPLS